MDVDNDAVVDRYLFFFQNVNSNYNFLRIVLFDLLNFYVSVYNYYIKYKKFIIFIEKKYNFLFDMAQNKKNVYTINKKLDKKLNLPPNTYIIVGLKNYRRYKNIKWVLENVINYDQIIQSYLLYLQNHIITLINGMNKFNKFYCYCLHVLFNYQFNNEITDLILLDNFNQLKQNYFLKFSCEGRRGGGMIPSSLI